MLDDLRMSSGIALEPLEAYQRAFEKGVLLGPEKFGAAAQLFGKAAHHLQQSDASLAARAHANGALYQFLSSRDIGAAQRAVAALQQIPQVEVPGTQDEIMSGPKLAHEIHARLLEFQAHACGGDARTRANAYRQAAHGWVALFNDRPVTFAFVADDPYADDGQTRFFLNAGVAALRDADSVIGIDPEHAAEFFALAAQAFGRCGDDAQQRSAIEQMKAARLIRRCWFCSREVQGLGFNLKLLAIGDFEYFRRLSSGDPERGESYEPNGGVYGCAACAAAVDQIAGVRVAELRTHLETQIQAMNNNMQGLNARLGLVEALSHRH